MTILFVYVPLKYFKSDEFWQQSDIVRNLSDSTLKVIVFPTEQNEFDFKYIQY